LLHPSRSAVALQIYQYVIHVTAHASVYTLVLMSLDRYLAVVHPITSMTIRNVRNTSVALALAWAVIVVANAPMLAVFQVRSCSTWFRRSAAWRVMVSGVRRMNEVNARWARLVLGWVTVFGRVYHLGM